jgi:hypothetical protein
MTQANNHEEKKCEFVEEDDHHHHSDDEEAKEKRSWKEKIIIRVDSKWKPIFDIFILIFVGYSCITTLYYIAFEEPTNPFHKWVDEFVEISFITDFFFNFVTAYVDD